MKRKIKDIVIRMDLYPRLRINDCKVQEYKEILTLLPPIIINQDNILIDGAHRLQAYKEAEQKEIEIEIVQTKDDDDILLKAIELNSRHGFQLTQKEKKKKIIELYAKIMDNKRIKPLSYDVKRLKESFSIPDSTFGDWTKDLNDELEAQLLEKILRLHLQCKTQQEIAEIVGLKHNTIADKIKKIVTMLQYLSENPKSEIPTIFKEIGEKWLKLSEFKPELYNIWNQSKMNNEIDYPGNVPVEFTENLIYYYTEPFDIVYDPFAGGGPTINACEKWFRRYYCSDRLPKEIRPEIKKWEIQEGLPKDLPNNIKLVFLDPPYWKQSENQYSKDKEDLANMSLEKFYEILIDFIKQLKKRLDKDGKIALIIQGTQWKNNLILEDHAFELAKRIENLGFKIEQRIICPYSTEQYNAQMVEKAKKEKICLTIYRDLIVFKLK